MPNQNEIIKPLVINADDYGFFHSVSRGILACAKRSAISAIGIMANGPHYPELQAYLHDLPHIDLGVHLNLTYGEPISRDYRKSKALRGLSFRPKLETAAIILQRSLLLAVVEAEWRAQIERCLESGLKICFLNSHEHIHLLPSLAITIKGLAREYGIDYVREPRPEWRRSHRRTSLSSILRNLLMQIAVIFTGGYRDKPSIEVIGIGMSGRLTLEYLNRCFSRLLPGRIYELMCHPGYFDSEEIQDNNLKRFHKWQQELDLLIGSPFKMLMERHHLRISNFRELKYHLSVAGSQSTNDLYVSVPFQHGLHK